jgi:hypothetical protein
MQKRSWKVKSLASFMRRQLPWVKTSDRATLRGWCEHEILGSAVFMELIEGGIKDQNSKPREGLINTWRNIRASQLKYGAALGMTPVARASIEADLDAAAVDIGQHVSDRALAIGELRTGPAAEAEAETIDPGRPRMGTAADEGEDSAAQLALDLEADTATGRPEGEDDDEATSEP